jgi:hypothetical protein
MAKRQLHCLDRRATVDQQGGEVVPQAVQPDALLEPEAVAETAPIDPAELVTLAELAAEGFGYGSVYVKTPRDAIEELAGQLGGEVVLDDVGRRCVSRDAARRLIAEREARERRGREAQERHQAELAELAAENRPRVGIPIPEGLEDVDAVTVLMQHEIEAETERKGARQRSMLDEMFTGVTVYHPIRDREEL